VSLDTYLKEEKNELETISIKQTNQKSKKLLEISQPNLEIAKHLLVAQCQQNEVDILFGRSKALNV
jgi:hypothetical protein